MACSMVAMQQNQFTSSLSLLRSSISSDFSGTRLGHSVQFKRNAVQAKGALQVTSSAKKILIMGGTRFISILLSRLLIKEGHQVSLFTRGKAPIAQQLPGESHADFADFSSKESCKYTGMLEDCCCDNETVNNLNKNVLLPLLQDLVTNHFFRYFKQKKRELDASAFGEDETGNSQARLTIEDLKYLFMA